jgi:RNA polymerase sigma factor (TIGR02999 family)
VGDLTLLLERSRHGDSQARDELFASVYAELNRLARQKLAGQPQFTNLNPASLVHEAYLHLVRQAGVPGANRHVFFGYAAKVMRNVIVDYVRQRGAQKRGKQAIHLTLTGSEPEVPASGPEVEELDRALRQLAQVDARAHEIVEMRYFAGLSVEEVADALGISPATVKREWQKARAFLFSVLAPNAR